MRMGFVIAAALVAAPAAADQTIGARAANFTATDADGRPVQLSSFAGRTVVLEWTQPGCPIVQRHYRTGNMQRTQAAARAQGVVWLSINSSAPGQQGNIDGTAAKQWIAAQKAQPTSYLLDAAGRVGHGYYARTTPNMFIIDAKGTLVYQGAIDDNPAADDAATPKARNHVLAALAEIRAGKPVSVAETRPYGCSVKYAS